MNHPDFIYLMGHRATGKTTTGQMAAQALDWEFVDLDDMIEAITGQSCAEIIADSEERFRRIERQTLSALRTRRQASGNTPCMIALGGGFHPLPDDGLRVWLYREGWRETARREREPLQRPGDGGLAEELDTMEAEREPRWEASAHQKLHIPRGRSAERAADELTTLIRWAGDLPDEVYCPKTWLTPTTPEELERAGHDASLFGLAGIELRSDLFEATAASGANQTPVLASLRNADPTWIPRVSEAADVKAVDIDLDFLSETLDAGVLESLDFERIIVSTHPSAPADDALEALLAEGVRLAETDIVSRDRIVLKYAPGISGIAELEAMLGHRHRALDEGWDVTVLPQGARYAWLRPMFAKTNATNYIPVGFDPSRRSEPRTSDPQSNSRPHFDVQRWLPHLAGPTPTDFDGLIGFPVEHSQGDVWHRRAALAADADEVSRSYLKIPIDDSLADALRLLHRLDLRGLSVTSPLKRRVVAVPFVDANELEAANTLTRMTPDGADRLWRANDTDAQGMRHCLKCLEEDYDIGPGDVAVIGTGGVAPAIRRAIEASNWNLVAHVAGRDGWPDVPADPVDLIVNAAGDHDLPYRDPPPSTAWLDLHYRNVREPPEATEVHLNGDIFFDGQAAAQRRIWSN
jgi:shikimate kinase